MPSAPARLLDRVERLYRGTYPYCSLPSMETSVRHQVVLPVEGGTQAEVGRQ